jgi:hypothetical protein
MGDRLRRVVVYTKPNCSLCDEAMEVVHEVHRGVSFDYSVVNILSNLDLYERFKHLIPLIEIDGAEFARYRVDADELARYLSSETDSNCSP